MNHTMEAEHSSTNASSAPKEIGDQYVKNDAACEQRKLDDHPTLVVEHKGKVFNVRLQEINNRVCSLVEDAKGKGMRIYPDGTSYALGSGVSVNKDEANGCRTVGLNILSRIPSSTSSNSQ